MTLYVLLLLFFADTSWIILCLSGRLGCRLLLDLHKVVLFFDLLLLHLVIFHCNSLPVYLVSALLLLWRYAWHFDDRLIYDLHVLAAQSLRVVFALCDFRGSHQRIRDAIWRMAEYLSLKVLFLVIRRCTGPFSFQVAFRHCNYRWSLFLLADDSRLLLSLIRVLDSTLRSSVDDTLINIILSGMAMIDHVFARFCTFVDRWFVQKSRGLFHCLAIRQVRRLSQTACATFGLVWSISTATLSDMSYAVGWRWHPH